MNINATDYTLIGIPQYASLRIGNVQPDGQLNSCALFLAGDGQELRPVAGTYNEATGELSFNDAEIPGIRYGTTFFDGHAIPGNGPQDPPSFSGTWSKVELTKSKGPPPPGKIGTIFVTHVNGQWAAINPEGVIE